MLLDKRTVCNVTQSVRLQRSVMFPSPDCTVSWCILFRFLQSPYHDPDTRLNANDAPLTKATK